MILRIADFLVILFGTLGACIVFLLAQEEYRNMRRKRKFHEIERQKRHIRNTAKNSTRIKGVRR